MKGKPPPKRKKLEGTSNVAGIKPVESDTMHQVFRRRAARKSKAMREFRGMRQPSDVKPAPVTRRQMTKDEMMHYFNLEDTEHGLQRKQDKDSETS